MSRLQLFCFTYAGGNASFFDEMERDLPCLDFVKLEYSGHGTRHKEPFYQSFDELADDMFQLLKRQYTGDRYALFGYSMGTIALVEVLKRIITDSDMRKPAYVFLAAHEPHSKAELIGFTMDEPDERVKNRTIRFGAVPGKLEQNQIFWRMYLPIYRADYSLIEKYSFEDLPVKVTIPAAVFYSENDTPEKEMKLWKQVFIDKCDFYRFEGTHFFIRDHHKEMADVIRLKLGV